MAHIVEGGNKGGVILDGQTEFFAGVEPISVAEASDGRTFNLQGVEVDGYAKGIVIRNGKKILK